MKMTNVLDKGGAVVKCIVGFGVSVTIAAITEKATEKVTGLNSNFIDGKVGEIKRLFKK